MKISEDAEIQILSRAATLLFGSSMFAIGYFISYPEFSLFTIVGAFLMACSVWPWFD